MYFYKYVCIKGEANPRFKRGEEAVSSCPRFSATQTTNTPVQILILLLHLIILINILLHTCTRADMIMVLLQWLKILLHVLLTVFILQCLPQIH